MREEIRSFKQTLSTSVADAIDTKVKADDNINAAILDEKLNSLKELMMARFDNMMQEEPQRVRVPVMVDAINVAAAPVIPKPNEWHHNNRFYRVPPTFCLPQGMTRLNGWRIWLTGLVAVHNNTSWMIKPIRELRGIDMPTKSQEQVLTLQWRPIFKYMQGVLGYSIPDKVDETFVRQSFDLPTILTQTQGVSVSVSVGPRPI